MSEKLLLHPQALCNRLKQIAIAAGQITLDYFEDSSSILNDKSDGSPVTIADQKAEDYIRKQLYEMLPNVPFIGEESKADDTCDTIGSSDYFWLVDPLDGTREFISGGGEYSVNVALVKNGVPFIGVIYAPYSGDLYSGCGEGTAKIWREDSGIEKPMGVRDMPKDGLTVMASKSGHYRDKLDIYLEQFKVKKLIKRGSSLKICAIASGKADLYARFGPTCEWDTAAAHAILNSAGGFIKDAETGHDLTYGHNRDEKWLNPEFIASGFDLPID